MLSKGILASNFHNHFFFTLTDFTLMLNYIS